MNDTLSDWLIGNLIMLSAVLVTAMAWLSLSLIYGPNALCAIIALLSGAGWIRFVLRRLCR